MSDDAEPDREVEPRARAGKPALERQAQAELEVYEAQRLAWEANRDFVEGTEWQWPAERV